MKRNMKTIKIVALIAGLVAVNSCKDFQDLQVDPNRVTQTHPSLILTSIEPIAFNVISLGSGLASRMLTFTDGADDAQYYGWQRAGFDRYNSLRDVVKMEGEANRLGLDNYKSLALFFKSFQIMEITKYFGDVPFSQALQATEGNYYPAYDLQKDIYTKVLDDLKAAGVALDGSKGSISGDVIYGGDITKWKKLINSFSLRVLMSLSLKTGNPTLNVINRFKEIVNDPATYPIFTSNADNAALQFLDLVNNRYPYLNNNSLKTAYYMEQSFVNLLKNTPDPRLFIFADKTPNGSGLPDADFSAYDGLDGSALLSVNTNRVVNGEVSRIDARYYSDPVNEASVALGYSEVEFTLAEASALGWIGDNPAVHYENGVRASMDFHGISTADQDTYLVGANVVYKPLTGVEMIITQKYISHFMNGGWEPFFNHLRTGFPAFSVNGGGVVNNQLVPKRWMYPQTEVQLNSTNLNTAIQRQYPSGDNINGVMWLLQPE